MRIDSELTSDYPFVGNATLSFLQLPVLDCTISTIGGVDLASIPGMYTWINITATWLLSQYTAPRFGIIDLRHNICPSCDGRVQAAPWSPEAVVEAAAVLGNSLKSGIEAAWAGVQAVRKNRIMMPPPPLLGSATQPSKKVGDLASDNVAMDGVTPSPGSSDGNGDGQPFFPKDLTSMAIRILLDSQWSNGTMFCMVLLILNLLFRLIRSHTAMREASLRAARAESRQDLGALDASSGNGTEC